MISKKIQRLRRLAEKAAEARDKFEAALEKAKGQRNVPRNWIAICEAEGLSPKDAAEWRLNAFKKTK